MSDEPRRDQQLLSYRVDQLEEAVEIIGDAMKVFQEFMLAAKVWARVGALGAGLVFGVIQPVVTAIIVLKLTV